MNIINLTPTVVGSIPIGENELLLFPPPNKKDETRLWIPPIA